MRDHKQFNGFFSVHVFRISSTSLGLKIFKDTILFIKKRKKKNTIWVLVKAAFKTYQDQHAQIK